MEILKKYFDEIKHIRKEDWEYFATKIETKIFQKKENIIEAGKIENYISFIQKGKTRLFIPQEEEDKEITFGFSFSGEFISAYDSFLTRTPSQYQIEALSQTHLWRISYDNLQKIYKKTDDGNFIGRIIAEKLFLIKSKRELSLLHETAEERYLNLFTERPNLFLEIPLKYIASYIGVTPQALSRIRKRIS